MGRGTLGAGLGVGAQAAHHLARTTSSITGARRTAWPTCSPGLPPAAPNGSGPGVSWACSVPEFRAARTPRAAACAAARRRPELALAALVEAVERVGVVALHRMLGGDGWAELAAVVAGAFGVPGPPTARYDRRRRPGPTAPPSVSPSRRRPDRAPVTARGTVPPGTGAGGRADRWCLGVAGRRRGRAHGAARGPGWCGGVRPGRWPADTGLAGRRQPADAQAVPSPGRCPATTHAADDAPAAGRAEPAQRGTPPRVAEGHPVRRPHAAGGPGPAP